MTKITWTTIYFSKKDRSRFDNFTLRASGSDWGSTLFRDALSQGIIDNYMNVEHMAYRPAVTFINGEYMGIHNIRSRIDENFIEENFGLLESEYDLIENNGIVENGDSIAFFELFELFENDLSQEENFQQVDNLMDMENFTDYFITEIWTGNSSWGHNIQMWKPKSPNTKWRWILQDLDRGFSGSGSDLISRFTTESSPSNYEWARKPLNSCLQNADFAQSFAEKFADHMYTTFHPTRVIEEINKYKAHIDQEIPNHVDRWAGTTSEYGNGIPSVEYWEGQVQDIMNFAQNRHPIMIADVQNTFDLDDPVDLTVVNSPSHAGNIELNGLTVPKTVWTGQYFANMPFTLTANPVPGQEFLGWSVAEPESLIEKGEIWKYNDQGNDLGNLWKERDYEDSTWSEGETEIGYGDNDEATTIDYGGNFQNKHITTYLRKEINIENVTEFTGLLEFNILVDDGAIIYLNGIEVLRINMPSGDVNFETLAQGAYGDPVESTFYSYTVQTDQILQGKNVLAIEVHQSSANSSDISFNMEINALKNSSEDIFSTHRDLVINLTSDSIFIANYQETSNCILRSQINENTTLTKDCSPYLAISEVTVNEGVTLTVEPGVEIKMPEDANLIIDGNLQAIGLEDDQIVFSSQNENTPWGAIIIRSKDRVSNISWAELKGASRGAHPIYENASISVFNGSVELDHITIEDVESNPILAYYSDVILTNSSIHSKVTGDLINVKYGTARVEQNSFLGNEQVDTDAIDYDEIENGIIRGNKIVSFLGYNSDGIDIGEESKNVLIENNFIHNCSDKGISVGQLSTIKCYNNSIINCDKGIAIKDLSTAEIDQITFYNVSIPISAFEKNIGLGGGTGFVTNNIFSNSSIAPVENDENSFLELSYNISDTDTLIGVENIIGNPYFSDPTYHNFTLLDQSMAIASGYDENGNNIDMGTKYHMYTGSPPLLISAIMYYPTTNVDAEFIELYNPKDEAINLEGYTFSESFDFVFPNYVMNPHETVIIALNPDLIYADGKKVFRWTDGRLSNEGEMIRLTSPSGIIVDQVLYDNKAPWPNEADGNGSFLSLKDYKLDNHFADSWTSDVVTSTNAGNNEVQIEAFPNPTKDFITLKSSSITIGHISLFDQMGRVIIDKSYPEKSEITLDLRSIISGIYFLKINNRAIKEVTKL